MAVRVVRPLPDQLADTLLARIRAGALRPGDRLPSARELEREFGVSRVVVREALRGLAAKGIVRVRQGVGAEVRHAGPEQMLEALELRLIDQDRVWPHLMEVRHVLEVAAVELAAERRTGADLAALAEALDGMAGALENAERFAEWDVAFHLRLVVAAQNPVLRSVTEPIGELLRASRLAILNPERGALPHRLLDEHHAIRDAVERRDRPGAAAAMREHLDGVARNMRRHLPKPVGVAG